MNKILFITTRNVLNTSGELRLIKNRTKVLYEKWGIITDFIVLASEKKVQKSNEEIGYSSSITKVILDHKNPISILKTRRYVESEIEKYLENDNYKCVILSGIGTFTFYKKIKAISEIPIFADMHSTKEELVEFFNRGFLKTLYNKVLYKYVNYSERKYLPKLSGALVVSNALAKYQESEYNLTNFKQYIIPCAIDDYLIDMDLREKKRNVYREKYNIQQDEILFIYSGGVSPWQCIDKSIDLFYKLKGITPHKIKMLILSHQINVIEKMTKGNKDIILDSVPANEVKDVLLAGDYAFLLRDNFVTNNVAYPNKFLEYVQSGMKIITTPYVYDIAEQLKGYGLGTIIGLNSNDVKNLNNFISNTSLLDDIKQREQLLFKTSFEETLKPFVEHLKINE